MHLHGHLPDARPVLVGDPCQNLELRALHVHLQQINPCDALLHEEVGHRGELASEPNGLELACKPLIGLVLWNPPVHEHGPHQGAVPFRIRVHARHRGRPAVVGHLSPPGLCAHALLMHPARRQPADALAEHRADRAHGLEAVHGSHAAMDDEEGGSHTDVRANVQDDIAGTDPNAMPQIRLLAGDLGELKPELRRVVVADHVGDSLDPGRPLGIGHTDPGLRANAHTCTGRSGSLRSECQRR